MKQGKILPEKESKSDEGSNLNVEYNQDLIFDVEKQSYIYDVDDHDKVYDHPLPYDSVSTGAINDDSTFDEANPYVGDEYETNKSSYKGIEKEFGVHIDESGKILNTSKKDKLLSETEEDLRDDLDEEGYPKNLKSKP